MAGLEDHAHSTLADLVEDQIVADQKSPALLLINGGGLIGRKFAGLDQGARQPQNPRLGVGAKAREVLGPDQTDVDQRV